MIQKKIKCYCGADITTTKGCHKVATKYFCKKCGKNISKIKLDQFIDIVCNDFIANYLRGDK
jgi:hypothetical protein